MRGILWRRKPAYEIEAWRWRSRFSLGSIRPALASRPTSYALVVNAEMPAPRVRDELRELRVAQMDQRRVVTSFEIDLGLVGNAVVNDDVELIANTNRRNSAVSAVLEE